MSNPGTDTILWDDLVHDFRVLGDNHILYYISHAIARIRPTELADARGVLNVKRHLRYEAKIRIAALGFSLVRLPPGQKSGFRAGFGPHSNRENFKIGLRPAEGRLFVRFY